ncbi:IS3 family transposase [Thalassotalea crassostreae]|uniref:IS3 family transposase n=2 Tax=Thalassotalea crassostreae TaxID=1763536 RepID=UPI0009EF4889|nr:IS3 family transposase [Thalassotalea crassostreae]
MVQELKAKYKLVHLLEATGLARSVYYYQCKALRKPDNYADVKVLIKSLFHEHKGRYGYRRVASALRSAGTLINHKAVQRLMVELNLKSKVRPKRYKSYRGEVGTTAPNLLERNFKVSKPNHKWVTDVTEFKVKGQKVYLSPILDLFNQEVISYEVRKSAHLPLVTDMINNALKTLKDHEKPVIHSDQGWQYRMKTTQNIIRKAGLKQSMSRKGNCLDNAVAENFFGILKTEMYHREEFKDADELIDCIKEYIHYYNNKRIKLKLKGLSPIEYRNQALLAA